MKSTLTLGVVLTALCLLVVSTTAQGKKKTKKSDGKTTIKCPLQIRRMGLEDELLREEISDFERGKRIPLLLVLLVYGRTAKVYVDVLIDDEVDLPRRLSSTSKNPRG